MLNDVFLRERFYYAMTLVILTFVLSFGFPWLFNYAKIVFVVLLFLVALDYIILKQLDDKISVERLVQEKLSLGDAQNIKYRIENNSKWNLHIELTDELPYQLQHRSFISKMRLPSNDDAEIKYPIRPLFRGLYKFGKLYLYYSNRFFSLVELRKIIDDQQEVKVIPSIIQMRKYALELFARTASLAGIRKVRRIGENDEFEHIRDYVQGDNIRAINWKASSRSNTIMVNQYQNTRSQNFYCILDKGRSMKMPFGGLSLLDHAINSSLVISNIVLRKFDRVGLISFSDKIGARIKAGSNTHQLELIIKSLYNQKTDFKESNFELLYYTVRDQISRRSILMFFTNFEHPHDLDRNLSYIKALNKKHLLVIVFFKNSELIETSEMECKTKQDIYEKTFAQKTLLDKENLQIRLIGLGIQTILTKPEELSINVINKYLEIKAKRLL